MSGPLFLGLDGGGTKTASVILDSALCEMGRGQGGPCNIATCADETLRDSVSTAARTALESAELPLETRFAGVCAGVAGFVVKSRRAEFARHLSDWIPADRHRVEPDYVIAYWGATEGEPGVVVIAGTGAVAYGRNSEGQEARADGRGFLLGDRGSGFDIGCRALRSVVRRHDGGLPANDFTARILSATECQDVEDLMEWAYRPFNPGHLASLVPAIAGWASQGDTHSALLLKQAAWVLRGSAQTVLKRLAGPGLPHFLLGNLWQASPILVEAFRIGAGTSPPLPLPLIDVVAARHDAAYGAALLANRESGA